MNSSPSPKRVGKYGSPLWAGFLFSGEGGGGTRAQRRGATRETKRATQNKQNNNSMATGGFCLVRSPLGGRPYQKKSTATGDTLWAPRIVLLSFYKLRLLSRKPTCTPSFSSVLNESAILSSRRDQKEGAEKDVFFSKTHKERKKRTESRGTER